jgi:hypothetical protein
MLSIEGCMFVAGNRVGITKTTLCPVADVGGVEFLFIQHLPLFHDTQVGRAGILCLWKMGKPTMVS